MLILSSSFLIQSFIGLRFTTERVFPVWLDLVRFICCFCSLESCLFSHFSSSCASGVSGIVFFPSCSLFYLVQILNKNKSLLSVRRPTENKVPHIHTSDRDLAFRYMLWLSTQLCVIQLNSKYYDRQFKVICCFPHKMLCF